MTLEDIKTTIIDGNNLAYRCRHTFNLSYKEDDVSVLYGFLRVLQAELKRDSADACVVAWDLGVPDFRYVHMKTYKQRDHGDELEWEEFKGQMNMLHEKVLPALGVLSVRQSKTEADDLMYWASKMLDGHKIIVTTDQDLYQAVEEDVTVYSPVKNIYVRTSNFRKIVGVDLRNYMFYKTMLGDGSDGIPGIKGVGHKTAQKLINDLRCETWNDLVVAMDHVNLISRSIKNKLLSFGSDGFETSNIVMDLSEDRTNSVDCVLDHLCEWSKYDPTFVINFLKSYLFDSLMTNEFYSVYKRLLDPYLLLKKNYKDMLEDVQVL